MVNFRSRRGPVWIAGYCFNQLKKAQVVATNISSSVDKILQDEADGVSYRVLAYLLLGVVRIYSKKVEYLLNDCEDVRVRLSKFVIKTKDNTNVETLRMSVTIPERFELDAFDLDILEDTGGCHIATPEEITLKDVLCMTEGFGQFPLETFEEFDFGPNTSSADHSMVEDIQQSLLMDMDFEVFPSNTPISFLADKDISHDNIFSQNNLMNLDTDLIHEDGRVNDDQTVLETEPYEDELHEERIRTSSQEVTVDIIMVSGREKEPVLCVKAFNESHQVDDEEPNMATDTLSSSCQMHQQFQAVHETLPCKDELHEDRTRISLEEEQIVAMETSSSSCQMQHKKIKEVNEAGNFQEIMERPQHDKSSNQEEIVDHGNVEGSVEDHDNEGKLENQDKVSLKDGKLSVIPPETKNCDATPQSKFRGGSVGKQKPGATLPELMVISTPAVGECSLFSRKRKVVFDRTIVMTNELLKKNIRDASDLVRRRNARPTLHAVLRQAGISSLSNGFYESLFPCSKELRFMFSKRIKISSSLKLVETLGKLDVSESQSDSGPEHIATSPQTLPQCQEDSLEHDESSLKLDASELETVGSPEHDRSRGESQLVDSKVDPGRGQKGQMDPIEHATSAPYTPPKSPKSQVRPVELPERSEIQNTDNSGPSSPHESIEREQSVERDEELDLLEEEANSCDTEHSELTGWSDRTSKVAGFLHNRFVDLKKQQEDQVVNFSHVLRGRSRKECARLFHEILVLKSTSYVDVNQNDAYGDIAIRNLPKLDQTFDNYGQ